MCLVANRSTWPVSWLKRVFRFSLVLSYLHDAVRTASSIAVMIVSASIPFSLASASIVCINGFCICMSLEFHFEPGPRNQPHRQPVHATVGRLEQHVGILDAAQPSFERLLPVHRLAHHELGEPSRDPPVVVGAAKRPIESRR